MDLGQIMNRAIGSCGRKLPPFKELTLLSMFKKLNLHKFLVFIVLWNEKLRFLISICRPKLVAFVSATLPCFTSAYNHCDILLHYHLPKMIGGLWEWTLTRDNFSVAFVLILDVFERWVDKAGVDVIGLRDLIEDNAFVQFNSALVVGQDVWVTVALSIDSQIISQQTLDHDILFK